MTSRLARAQSIEDLRSMARGALPRMLFDYIDGAALTESTARANRQDLDAVALVPSPLSDVSQRDCSVTLFGRKSSMPLIIGPTGFNSMVWPRGDIALARAASASGIPFVMSNGANASMAELRADADADARHWFQIYLPMDRDRWTPLIESARSAGFEALEVTVDTAVPGRRLRDLHNGYGLPMQWTLGKVGQMVARPRWLLGMVRQGMPKPVIMEDAFDGGARNATMSELMAKQINPSVTWEDLKRLRDLWRGPLIVKGLIDPTQIETAVSAGYDGVLLSNHGGRQLDGSVSTIAMLPECAQAANGRITLLIDSGFRTGTDILRALALGASAVQVGRATLFGLAAGGEGGVARALEILRLELDVGMALAGTARLDPLPAIQTRRGAVWPA